MAESENGDFGACVAAADWALGALVQELKRLGQFENTLIIFTSDNGSRGDHGASNGVLRGAKCSTWEGGQRVPCVMRWPGVTPEGVQCRAVASQIDFLPTFASLAGAAVPDDRMVDGRDMSALIKNGAGEGRGEFRYYAAETLEAIRIGEWKLHLYKDGAAVQALYHLPSDPGETTNLFSARPDVVSSMLPAVEAARADLGCAGSGVVGKNVREIGRVAHGKKLTAPYDPSNPYIIALYDKEEDF